MTSQPWTPSDEDFFGTYGPWLTRTPEDVCEFFTGYDGTWFIAGGWAIEAFTGIPRDHEDCDISVLHAQVEKFRSFVRGGYNAWAAGSGALKPVFADDPASFDDIAHAGAEQLWLRPSWNKPWEYDVLLAPGDPKTWVYKRDTSITMPMSDALWTKDEITYLRPEIQLLYKAKGLRSKDQQDFDTAWPMLAADQQRWLRNMLSRTLPGHPWLSAP